MNGRDLLLILAHLFRMKGNPVQIEDAVEFISFRCRYSQPSQVRRMLTMAITNGMVSRNNKILKAEFLFDRQKLPPNLISILSDDIKIDSNVEPMF
jgi:hypothetical protein